MRSGGAFALPPAAGTGENATGAPVDGNTVAGLLRWGAAVLRAAGDTASLEAELLLGHALGAGREWLYAHPEQVPPSRAGDSFRASVRERAETRCPVAYLTGRREFCGLGLAIQRGIFIPRPETEGLVDLVAEWWVREGASLDGEPVLVDACCGSGAIGVALAWRVGMRVIATDVSAAAVALTERNAAACGVGGRVSVRRGAGLSPLGTGRRVRAVVANPPYVRTDAIAGLDPDIRCFEPRESLDGGEDGLKVVRGLAGEAAAAVTPGGLLALEIGAEGADGALAAVLSAGWRYPRIERDLAGFPRFVLAVQPRSLAEPGPCGDGMRLIRSET